uniref:Oxysterol-binding protein n=1 Tax=Culicoides sonorensis TaxID=179676 RepID=A0A336KJY0_CULSO
MSNNFNNNNNGNNGNTASSMTSSTTNVSMTPSQPMASRPSSEPLRDTLITGNSPPSASKSLVEDKKMRRTSLQVLLPHMPSSDSLLSCSSPGPTSPPGLNVWNESGAKIDTSTPNPDKIGHDSKLNRKESYKAQRKSYRMEKKRVAAELLNSIQDPTVVVLEDWLKVRGSLKSWTKLWCVLKPGLLLIYKSQKAKSSHWVGTVLLTSCQVIERPSKKDGFCFKLFHPLDQSIWAPKGPERETMGAVVQPLPTSYLIFRAASQAAGKCWMDALELSLRCSALLIRSVSNSLGPGEITDMTQTANDQVWSDADYEKHFMEHANLHPVLLKYLPASPRTPKLRTTSLDSRRGSVYPNSPCPSPTPVFQHLYFALAQWERCLSESPDYIKDLFNLSKDTDGRPRSNSMDSFYTTITDPDNQQSNVSVTMRQSNTSRRQSTPASMPSMKLLTSSKQLFNRVLEQRESVDSENLDDIDSTVEVTALPPSDGGETDSESENGDVSKDLEEFPETPYIFTPEPEFGGAGEQVEELPEEHKSLIWFLVKQVRPGMDLSKVVLPTFILEPRSFLDKLSDSYYHADILAKAVQLDDPFQRMKTVVQWYLSGFYKKPKGLKKPYNPILGETFRCYWEHPNGSRTFYIAEQVSHHPPVSAFYVTNRQDGFCISCSILAKSKFYGNSTSAILDGTATLTLLPRGESYTLTIPYAHCKGILMGTLSMELGGKITIDCENTGYKTELEFKLKPFIGGSEYTNLVTGKIKLGKETLASINGHWDSTIFIKENGQESILFEPTPEIRAKRLKRYTVPMESQGNFESERLWQLVTAAIDRDDQVGATEEKTALEEAQRAAAKERKATCSEWVSQHFTQDIVTGHWHYKYADLRPWDPNNDVKQYESGYKIQTKTKHQAPMVRTSSLISSEPMTLLQAESRSSLQALKAQRKALAASRKISSNSTPDHTANTSDDSNETKHSTMKIVENLEVITKKLDDQSTRIVRLQQHIDQLQSNDNLFKPSNILVIVVVLFAIIFNSIITAFMNKKHQ